MTNDPTYVRSKIEANTTWYLAWVMSEMLNDNAPIGWGRYIPLAKQLREHFEIVPKGDPDGQDPSPSRESA